MPVQYLTLPDGSIHPGVSLSVLEEAGVLIVRPVDPPTGPGMIAVEGDPEMRDGVLWQTWIMSNPTPVILDPEEVRAERNAKLTASDWTQLPDSPLTNDQRAEWSVYRHLLREVAGQQGFPSQVIWPEPPGQ
jgi:hypothetical protein